MLAQRLHPGGARRFGFTGGGGGGCEARRIAGGDAHRARLDITRPAFALGARKLRTAAAQQHGGPQQHGSAHTPSGKQYAIQRGLGLSLG
ncbi:hypothetical protein SDC9_117224 [bioreactor metagenome]|uniref:Uncharacterized protein n=1 Tax=bioreactor metagenome TaxID=1076179 RepID=A0A645BXQ5_9ZZZZ